MSLLHSSNYPFKDDEWKDFLGAQKSRVGLGVCFAPRRGICARVSTIQQQNHNLIRGINLASLVRSN